MVSVSVCPGVVIGEPPNVALRSPDVETKDPLGVATGTVDDAVKVQDAPGASSPPDRVKPISVVPVKLLSITGDSVAPAPQFDTSAEVNAGRFPKRDPKFSSNVIAVAVSPVFGLVIV